MAKSKRSSRNRPSSKARSSRQPEIADTSIERVTDRAAAIVWGLLLARWMIPTEGTAEGDTLWLTSLTLAAAAGFCWWKSRVSLERLRFERLDITVWFLCGAHILSSLIVILTEGNKRAATNMLWEWLAVAVTFSLIRQTITLQSRTRFLETVLVITTALACYGIWQPTFWYPSNLREYEAIMAEIDSVESSPEMPSQERAKRQMELRAECVSLGIPLSGPAQQLFERRLRDSQEPLGFFALTNTLASFMTVAVVLLAGTLLNVLLPSRTEPPSTERNNRGLVCALGTALLLVAYCLVLTKSRSAWGGTLVGLSTLIGLFFIRSKSGAGLRKLIPIIAVGLVAISLLAGVAIATGALDKEVLTEASMSLTYRLEYWTSTWDVFLDHPLFGTGPGNFRDNYLRHKLPQSSEEISDPHQFILDVAANAGLVGVVGLVALLVIIGWCIWQLCRSDENVPQRNVSDRNDSIFLQPVSIRAAIGAAALLTVAGEWLFSGSLAWSVLSVCLVALAIAGLIGVSLKRSSSSAIGPVELPIPAVAVAASLVAIFVHLSAAGGIAMPAVIGLTLALAAVLSVDSKKESMAGNEEESQTTASGTDASASAQNYQQNQNLPWLMAALFSGLTAVGCTLTAFSPVIQATSLLQLGDYDAINGQPARVVLSSYRDAAKADSLTPEPYIHLSQFYLHQWKQTRDQTYFDQSIQAAEQAQVLSPNSPQIAHELANAWLVRARESSMQNAEAIAEAVVGLQKALEMYPTNPMWTAETSQALALAGKSAEASRLARRALELDEINRGAGHVDRYLPEELLLEMKQLAGK